MIRSMRASVSALLFATALADDRFLNLNDESTLNLASFTYPDPGSLHSSCPLDSPLSCSGSSQSTCCYEGSDGIFMLTQFWDYDPATGPADLFTLHGLWVDKCSGGYNQYCNPSWEISDPSSVLQKTGNDALLQEMNQVWKNLNGNDEELWLHEFNKHGTCMATVNPSCYTDATTPQYQYAADFYSTALRLFSDLNTYQFLNQSGFAPSETATYNVADFENALSSHVDGTTVGVVCDRHNVLNEIYYYYKLKGSVASGQFVPYEFGRGGNCKDGFHWYPKGSSGGGPGNPGTGPSTAGYLKVSGQNGCLISNGKWYTSGTCATFKIKNAPFGGIVISSSKGNCDVIDGEFSCARRNAAGQFELSDDDTILYNGANTWSADGEPSGTSQAGVSIGNEKSVTFELVFRSK